jgi:hypothetical protein
VDMLPIAERALAMIAIDDEFGRTVAAARIEVIDPASIRASLHVESGHLPVGSRQRLVDAVLDEPEVRARRMLHVALPLGDTELLQHVRQRCTTGEPRAAGVSCLIDAELPGPRPASEP